MSDHIKSRSLGLSVGTYLRLRVEASIGFSVESGDFSVQRQQKINWFQLWQTSAPLGGQSKRES